MLESTSGNPGDAKFSPSPAYPAELARKESELIATRRRAAFGAQATVTAADGSLPADTVGLALSGGGIRSATFCLGVLQTLSRLHLLRKVDLLSTVSGGGYCGSFLGALFCRAAGEEKTRRGVAEVENELADPHSKIVGWLRENGRYLSPNGSGDVWTAFAVLLRNLVAVQTVLFTFVLAWLAAVVLLRVLLGNSPPTEDSVFWSPFWWLTLAPLAAAIPLAWAYWIVPRVDPNSGKPLSRGPVYRTILLVVLLGALWLFVRSSPGVAAPNQRLLLVVTAAWGLLLWALTAYALVWIYARRDAKQKRPDSKTRNVLSHLLALSLKVTVFAAGLAAIDTLGGTLYVWLEPDGIGAFGTLSSAIGAGGAAAVIRLLVRVAQSTNGKGRVPLPLGVVAGAAAVLAAGTIIVALSAVAHAVAWRSLLVPYPSGGELQSIATLLAAALVLSYIFGRTIRFANDSSHQALYGARLTRAYLGASNPARVDGKDAKRSVTEPIAGDDISLDDYAPFAAGGPLHLINVTFNETVAGESQIEHRDRKGLNLAVGPAGLSAGVRHHAVWHAANDKRDVVPVAPKAGYRIFCAPSSPAAAGAATSSPPTALQNVEALSVATWVAISGAAVAPGLGSRTSLGFSMLLTLFNVRLGYWWNSGVDPSTRRESTAPGKLSPAGMARVFPVQTYLFYELLGRFYGPNRQRWYLSDGGHFENTACYELVRRRVPFIIACDCGQDGEFDFTDIANLVRKARTDFDAEIRFLTRDELAGWNVDERLRDCFGVPSDFERFGAAPAAAPRPRPCAMLARVDYDNGPGQAESRAQSFILFLKPSLIGDEPEDLLNYAHTHADFPHESTGDQYFDEAQWEAYRKLGEVVATRVFGAAAGASGRWLPQSCSRPVRAAASVS